MSALDYAYQEFLGQRPTSPEWAVHVMNIAMWRFALQYVENLDDVRSDVVQLWSLPDCLPGHLRPPTTANEDQPRCS